MGGWGGGSLNLEILRGGGLKQFWISRWMGGGGGKKLGLPGGGGGRRGKKIVPSVVGVWIFYGITHCMKHHVVSHMCVLSGELQCMPGRG